MLIRNPKYPELVGVRAVEPRERFVVHITFTDGTEREMDLDPYIGTGPVFAPIRHDPLLFRQIYVDPETETLTWPNGADIAPETLYYDGPPPWANESGAKARTRRVSATKTQRRSAAPRPTPRTR
jgi:hypothetical protein